MSGPADAAANLATGAATDPPPAIPTDAPLTAHASAARHTGLQASVALALLSFVWLAALAWPRPLLLPDEGRYVGVAWEMMRSGDWLTPTLDGLPYFHKPPLFYWITAASMTLFGPSEWAARAAPLLGAWVGAMALYLLVRRWWGAAVARRSLWALLAQPLFYIGGQFANLDMLVAGCITTTIVLLVHAALCLQQRLPYKTALAAAYAFAALGLLAKGLIGVVIPALVVAVWLIALRRWRSIAALLWWPGGLLLLLLAAPWFMVMQARFAGFLDYFFVVQHFKRFAAGGFNNVQPFWFYPAVLVLFTLPWLPWLRGQFKRGQFSDPERGDLRLLMVLWVGLVLLFFSLPKSKLLGYILPAVPPLAVLLADAVDARVRAVNDRAARWWWASAGVSSAISIAVIAMLSVQPGRSNKTLAEVLLAQRGVDEPVFMLGDYLFDLPFYARLKAPTPIVLDWTDPDIPLRDNWRKELADAAAFAPLRARTALLQPEQLVAAVCSHAVSWLVGPSAAAPAFALLANARAVSQVRGSTLWRIEAANPDVRRRLDCAGTPNADSASR